VKWCSSFKCFLLIPKPDKFDGNFSALLVKNDEKCTKDEIKNAYKSLLNNSDQNERKCIVKMSSFQKDSLELELELADMFNKSISVQNRTHLIYVIQGKIEGLTVYVVEDKSNKTIHISNAEDKSTERAHKSNAQGKSNEGMHINGDMQFILKIIGVIIFTISILICGFLCYAFVFQPNY
jgi:hypothetical protein